MIITSCTVVEGCRCPADSLEFVRYKVDILYYLPKIYRMRFFTVGTWTCDLTIFRISSESFQIRIFQRNRSSAGFGKVSGKFLKFKEENWKVQIFLADEIFIIWNLSTFRFFIWQFLYSTASQTDAKFPLGFLNFLFFLWNVYLAFIIFLPFLIHQRTVGIGKLISLKW